jgi:hypothetical protein
MLHRAPFRFSDQSGTSLIFRGTLEFVIGNEVFLQGGWNDFIVTEMDIV